MNKYATALVLSALAATEFIVMDGEKDIKHADAGLSSRWVSIALN